MSTPATTPAPQKITPDCQPVFPCWLFQKATQWHWAGSPFWNEMKPSSILAEGWTHFLPDQPTAPTCTPSEGDKPVCKYCGGTGVVSYSAGGESRLDECGCGASPQPTHSAQEAAELLAKASKQLRLEEHAPERLVQEIDDFLRHFPSTPTQSQQPPLSPGSGEALRENTDESGSPILEKRHGDTAKKIYGIAWNAIVDEGADLDEGSVIEAIALELHDYGSRLAPPLPSIGDGKDGGVPLGAKWPAWMWYTRMVIMSWGTWKQMTEAERAAYRYAKPYDAPAQSPQSGREEK